MHSISKIATKLIYLMVVFSLCVAMGLIALFLSVGPGLPEVESIREIRLQTPMSIYASDNQLIAEFGDKRRIPITLDQVPKDFINALLATEDQRFFEHSGVDFLGVARAVINLAVTGSKSQGASTITMLVARNYYLTRERRFSRKITEMFLAWKIESELSKTEILELFLNKIPFGHRAFGIGAASQVYYGTTLDKLSLAKLATLAGIPKGQSIFNPISNPAKAESRRSHVLGRMLAEGFIDQTRYESALQEPIEASKHGARSTVDAAYLAEMVRRFAVEKFGVDKAYNDGLKFYTTLKPTLQHYAQQALVDGLEEYDRRHGFRGAEHHFEIDQNTSSSQIASWLEDFAAIGNLQPAIVIAVDDQLASAIIQLKDQSTAALSLENIKWARAYVDENHLGKPVTEMSQVLQPGDLIRVKSLPINSDTSSDVKSVTTYQLAQIPEVSGGFVVLTPDNGAIDVLIGGFDFALNQYNMVNQASRQVGSNIKPFIYSAAFEKNYTPASIINDMPIVEADITAENFWRPKNDGDKYLGPTSLRVGLRRSKNTVSIRLIRSIGPRYAKTYLENIGFPGGNMSPYLSLALGSASFTPLEVVTGYATLANGGYKVTPWFVSRVEDNNGQIIFEHQPIQVCKTCEKIIAEQMQQQMAKQDAIASQAGGLSAIGGQQSDSLERQSPLADELSDQPAFHNMPLLPIPEAIIAPRVIEERNRFLVDSILKDVIHRGTAVPTLSRTRSKLLKRNDLAGKTGTTNDAKDAWFSGYNTKYVATAWVGFDDHTKKLGVAEFGGKAALPIWQKFMEKALEGVPQSNHPTPPGIVTVRIDPKTGLLATQLTENPIFEVFRSENAPTKYADRPIENIFDENGDTADDETIF